MTTLSNVKQTVKNGSTAIASIKYIFLSFISRSKTVIPVFNCSIKRQWASSSEKNNLRLIGIKPSAFILLPRSARFVWNNVNSFKSNAGTLYFHIGFKRILLCVFMNISIVCYNSKLIIDERIKSKFCVMKLKIRKTVHRNIFHSITAFMLFYNIL